MGMMKCLRDLMKTSKLKKKTPACIYLSFIDDRSEFRKVLSKLIVVTCAEPEPESSRCGHW